MGVGTIRADTLSNLPPAKSAVYKDVVKRQLYSIWPDDPFPVYLPAQIEQETCISLTHRKCWNAKAELRTDREWGVGLNQMTIAYNKDGSERFNTFKELKQSSHRFDNWTWEDRYNPDFQILAIVMTMQKNWTRVFFAKNDVERYAMALNTYNGGYGGLIKDIDLCRRTPKCDPGLWYGNVELYSTKSKEPQRAYGGRSFYEMSREYPHNIMHVRNKRYETWFND